jgi:hypothetical protein
MNPLESVFQNHAYDYFCLLGGSGRYEGYREWHPAGLVLMIATGIEPPQSQEWNILYDGSGYLSSKVWRETDQMPYQVSDKLKSITLTRSMFEEFIESISNQLQKISPIDEYSWNSFLEEQRDHFERFLCDK